MYCAKILNSVMKIVNILFKPLVSALLSVTIWADVPAIRS